MTETLLGAFEKRFGHARRRVARAPGRVNLIGEHTDYNDGFVLPVAIDRYVMVAFASNGSQRLRGYSIDFEEEGDARLEALEPPSGAPSWFDYASGVAWALLREGASVRGMDFVVAGDIPIGAGLSSSAALELAIARALFFVADIAWDGRRAAKIGQKVENDYVGLESGIMDQMASALSEDGCAMLLDCRDLSFESVALPEELAIVVMDTGTRRELAGSAYNARRRSCQEAARLLSVEALRDVELEPLSAARSKMDEVTFRRVLHVVQENARTLEMAAALRKGELGRIGSLMASSHESLRDLYEVSSPELDRIVAHALEHRAAVGARMTGAGFGGCAVALVMKDGLEGFLRDFEPAEGAKLYPCRAVSGVTIFTP